MVAAAKRKRASKQKPSWTKGDQVLVDFDGDLYAGEIKSIRGEKARVTFEDGDKQTVELSKLLPHPDTTDDDENESDESLSGFLQYAVKWDESKINFTLVAEGVKFYGWWRKTRDALNREICWAIDLFATHGDKQYGLKSIGYYVNDPRDDMRSLNADICAASNEWFYQRCSGNIEMLDDLQKRATRPTVKITKLRTLDNLILKLTEFRNTCILQGGTRLYSIQGEAEGDPIISLVVDVTRQAAALGDGPAPPLHMGGLYDEATGTKTKARPVNEGSGRIEKIPDQQNVMALVDELEKSIDASRKRKIRAVLRKMGHAGGARSIKAKLKAEQGTEPELTPEPEPKKKPANKKDKRRGSRAKKGAK